MHPVGLYVPISGQRERGWTAAGERRSQFARVDALPIAEPEPVSRIGRLAGVVRRRVMRTAGA